MACIDRNYQQPGTAIEPVPDVPTDPNDWASMQRLLQRLWVDAQRAATLAAIPNTLLQGSSPGTPQTGVLPAPTTLVATGNGPIALSWDAFPAAYTDQFSYYKIYRGIVNNITLVSPVATINATRFLDSDIVVAATYYYWVSGVTKDGREGIPAGPVSASFAGFPTTYLADLSVTAAKIAALAVTTTKIDDNSISTPKLQALAVTAAKIDVGQLSAISADVGTITAGILTGAVIRSSASNPKTQLDSNGLRTFDAGGNVLVHVSGAFSGVKTSQVFGRDSLTVKPLVDFSEALLTLSNGNAGTTGSQIDLTDTGSGIIFSYNGAQVANLTSAFTLASGSIIVASGQGIMNGAGESVAIAANEVQAYVNSTLVGKFDGTNDATNTNFYLYHNGSLKQVKVIAGVLQV